MPATNPAEEFHIVIPARYAAKRFPGKLLREVNARPLIVRAYESALACGAASVTVATDHEEIAACIHRYGGTVWMSDQPYASGSDRVAAVARAMAWAPETIVVNIQGDEASVAADDVRNLCSFLTAAPQAAMATLAKAKSAREREDFEDRNVVKVVCRADGRAVYFSRAAIPCQRDEHAGGEHDGRQSGGFRFCRARADRWHHHIGVYACRCGYLSRFSRLPRSPLECMENLEQLRALEKGDAVYVLEAISSEPHGIDSHADLRRARALAASG